MKRLDKDDAFQTELLALDAFEVDYPRRTCASG
jgi:hypothetical protein